MPSWLDRLSRRALLAGAAEVVPAAVVSNAEMRDQSDQIEAWQGAPGAVIQTAPSTTGRGKWKLTVAGLSDTAQESKTHPDQVQQTDTQQLWRGLEVVLGTPWA